MSNESFIYLGFVENEFYFIHDINNKMLFTNNIYKKIYEYLIYQTAIKNTNCTIIIFELHAKKLNIIVVRHKNIETKFNKIYNSEELKQILNNCLNINIDASFIVNYTYDTDKMKGTQVDYNIVKCYFYINDLDVNQIFYLKTNCKINEK